MRSRHLFAAFAGGSRAELSQRGRRQSVNGQLDQHNQQHRDQNCVRPDDWHDVARVSPEFAHAVLERASLASVIRVGSAEEVAASVSFARAASSFARASLLGGRQERLVLRHRGLLRRAEQRFAPRHRGDRRSATSSKTSRLSSLFFHAVKAACECRPAARAASSRTSRARPRAIVRRPGRALRVPCLLHSLVRSP